MKGPVPSAVVLALALSACAHGTAGTAGGPAGSIVPSDLNPKIALRLTGIGVRHGLDAFDFTATNRTSKIVSSFDADVVLSNAAGTVLYRGRLQESTVVEPGNAFDIEDAVVNAPQRVPNPALLGRASPASTRVTYRIVDIGYADGSKETAGP